MNVWGLGILDQSIKTSSFKKKVGFKCYFYKERMKNKEEHTYIMRCVTTIGIPHLIISYPEVLGIENKQN